MSEVVGAAKSGEEVAQSLAFDERLVGKLRSLAVLRFRIPEPEIEDLVQRTWIEVSMASSPIGFPDAFVTRVFYVQCCRWLTAERRRRASHDDAEAIGRARAALSPDDLLALRQALGRLPETSRRLLVAYFLEGKSLKEAGAETGHSPKQVWKRVEQALSRMRKEMQR